MLHAVLVVVVVVGVVVVGVGVGGVGAKQEADMWDATAAARCVAKCWTPQKKDNHACVTQCLREEFVKPGACPDTDVLTEFAAACVDVCLLDVQCPDTDKCCANTCGVTCQPAQGLNAVAGLPPIPGNISVTERRRGRQVFVEWSGASAATPVVYVLQERHHVGRTFAPTRLGSWTQPPKQRPALLRNNVTLKHVLRPGRWYQFRVAAVNERGTQGFSPPSQQFSLTAAPKAPRAPEMLKVGGLTQVNGTFWGELSWQAPASDLPIQRYKVFWSRQLLGAAGPPVSVLVKHQTVSKDVTRFSLKHLEADSMYFLQVQALAHYGKERLKGEKTAIVLNTTISQISTGAPGVEAWSKRSLGRVTHLRVQKMFWRDGQLMARIAWTPTSGQRSRYTVTWWSGACQAQDDGKRVEMSATTEAAHFEVYGLGFECKYRVTVRQHGSTSASASASIVFVTPSCEVVANRPPCPSSKPT